jgi:hypothetical protein
VSNWIRLLLTYATISLTLGVKIGIVQTLECEHLLDEESRGSDFPLLARSLSLLVHGKPR